MLIALNPRFEAISDISVSDCLIDSYAKSIYLDVKLQRVPVRLEYTPNEQFEL